jgi:hypothetical protein
METAQRKERDEAALRVLDEQCADIRERRVETENEVKQDVAEMKARWASEAGAYTRPLFSSTRAVSQLNLSHF